MKICSATAPSNIALIKYMGKTSHTVNTPANASISLTLDHLLSEVEIHDSESATDSWQPLIKEGWTAPELSEKGQARFLKHFAKLKEHFGIDGSYQVLSANNFPSDCGIASSASSFAALTLAAFELAKVKGSAEAESTSMKQLSELSRQGSGSSCRSLYTPWALWRHEYAEPVEGLPADLEHQVIILNDEKKEVSSSEAHKRVTTSPSFEGRIERAESRLESLLTGLGSGDWKQVSDICLVEFEDMHELFETSEPSFSYRTDDSRKVVEMVKSFWQENGDGPAPTMDAGANVHLLWRADQALQAAEFAASLPDDFQVVASPGLAGD
ncbi:MAG: diphosphomevalonate decarboxylase [Bdellovibrionales bacterium]|nr:diphosphomevalonate decarboxylase [Bdellovibrionales bacterium]